MLSANQLHPELNVGSLIAAISEVTGVTSDQITSRCKLSSACEARNIAWTILYDRKLTTNEIGKHFHRTHGAVHYGIRRIKLDMERDFRVMNKVQRVKQLIDLSDPIDVLRIAHEGRGLE